MDVKRHHDFVQPRSEGCAIGANQNDLRCQLLELPAELRINIYRFAVVNPTAITIHPLTIYAKPKGAAHDYPTRVAFRLEPGLAATSKQVRSEMLQIFYRENTFDLDEVHEKKQGLAHLRHALGARAGMLRSLRFSTEVLLNSWSMFRELELSYRVNETTGRFEARSYSNADGDGPVCMCAATEAGIAMLARGQSLLAAAAQSIKEYDTHYWVKGKCAECRLKMVETA